MSSMTCGYDTQLHYQRKKMWFDRHQMAQDNYQSKYGASFPSSPQKKGETTPSSRDQFSFEGWCMPSFRFPSFSQIKTRPFSVHESSQKLREIGTCLVSSRICSTVPEILGTSITLICLPVRFRNPLLRVVFSLTTESCSTVRCKFQSWLQILVASISCVPQILSEIGSERTTC